MEQQKQPLLEATAAASKALLVIINTKSFQKQQPQFPTEKKKKEERWRIPEKQSSRTKITTNFGLRPNQYTPRAFPARAHWIQDGGHSTGILIGSDSSAHPDVMFLRARSPRSFRHLGDFSF